MFLEMDTHHPHIRYWLKKVNKGLFSFGFEALRESRMKYVNNPLIDYLSKNSLTNKTVDLRGIILELSLDYLVLSETNIDQSFTKCNFT